MLFAIRAIHTLIFIFEGSCVGYIFYVSLALSRTPTWQQDRLVFLAIAVVIAEGFVLVLNRGKCPLTALAQKHGGQEERLADIFLPKVFSPYLLRVIIAMFVFAMIVLVIKSISL
ncbi:MAG TPA: hypothetical protein VGK02_01125 [Candidatus Aquicultor sp.]